MNFEQKYLFSQLFAYTLSILFNFQRIFTSYLIDKKSSLRRRHKGLVSAIVMLYEV